MYPYNYDEKANDVIHYAFVEARDMGHNFVGTEHIVLGLMHINDSNVSDIFEDYSISIEDIRLEIVKKIGRAEFRGIEDYTQRAKECLERSHLYAIQTNQAEIIPEHLFISIMHDPSSMGYQILNALKLDIKSILRGVLKGVQVEPPITGNIIKRGVRQSAKIKTIELEENYEESKGILEQIGYDLTERAKDYPFDSVIGREKEIDRMLQILSRKQKNNVCLVGDPGVGKTAIVYGLANRIAQGNVPDVYKHKRIIEINIGSLVSGTMFRGQFEERMKAFIDALVSDKNVIVFIDEIHNLLGVGSTGDKALDASGMLKPFLATGQIQLIGATTYNEFDKYIEQDQAFLRRLMVVHVEEPSEKETWEILNTIKDVYESHHKVVITPEAIQAAILLSKRYLPDRKWPDKAIDLIDEACSRKRMENVEAIELVDELKYRLNHLKSEKEKSILQMDFQNASKIVEEEKRILNNIERDEKAKSLMSKKQIFIELETIEEVVSDWSKIPITQLSSREKERITMIDTTLKKVVFGQEHAIDVVSRAIKRARIGMHTPGKPMGVYLFVGPTGVGKTELCKQIAIQYFGDEKHLIKIDMSEFMEKHSVSKLIGAPPGYEGFKEGGQLTKAIRTNPYAVVVFDEIEKAHEEVVNILLQIMDEGSLKDGKGKKVSFKDALIVMTSNLGAASKSIKRVGFGQGNDGSVRLKEACKAFFRPEFINRVTEIVVFEHLDKKTCAMIVNQKVEELAQFLKSKNIVLHVSQQVVDHISTQYYSEIYGARPLIRGVEETIQDAIAEVLLTYDEALTFIEFEWDQVQKGVVYKAR